MKNKIKYIISYLLGIVIVGIFCLTDLIMPIQYWLSDDPITWATIFKVIEPYLGIAFLALMVLVIVYSWIKRD